MAVVPRAVFAAALAALSSTFAHAELAISRNATQNVTCSAGVCSATAAKAVLNDAELAGMLAGGSVTVASTSVAGDIVLARGLSWTSANTLTLDAFGSVVLRGSITVAGPGGLTVKTNDGGSGGDFLLKGARVEFSDPAGALEIDGKPYALVDTIDALAAAVAADPAGHYALAKNYRTDISHTYTAPPVPTPLGGTFEGLGNTITGLNIKDTDPTRDEGLFLELSAGGVIRDVTIEIGNLEARARQGTVGFLVARNSGSLLHDHVQGWVLAQNANTAGGLAGINAKRARIVDCDTYVTFFNVNGHESRGGGLAGFNDGIIAKSFAAGDVAGGTNANTGGLVGENSIHGSVSGSGAIGSVVIAGRDGNGGGLVGLNDGSIVHSWADGPAVEGRHTGGLAGVNNGAIKTSYSTANIHVEDKNGESGGGLVGTNTGSIRESYAEGHAGAVKGTALALGGLAGINSGAIVDSYALGGAYSDKGNSPAGGLVGVNFGTLATSYTTGYVTGHRDRAGGVIGIDNNPGGASAVYWDRHNSGIADPGRGAGTPRDDPGLVAIRSEHLVAALPPGLSPAVWGHDSTINFGAPYLLAIPPRYRGRR